MFAFDKITIIIGLVVFCLAMVAYLLREVMDLKNKLNTLGSHVQQLHTRLAPPPETPPAKEPVVETVTEEENSKKE
jgi:hypothetical protein